MHRGLDARMVTEHPDRCFAVFARKQEGTSSIRKRLEDTPLVLARLPPWTLETLCAQIAAAPDAETAGYYLQFLETTFLALEVRAERFLKSAIGV